MSGFSAPICSITFACTASAVTSAFFASISACFSFTLFFAASFASRVVASGFVIASIVVFSFVSSSFATVALEVSMDSKVLSNSFSFCSTALAPSIIPFVYFPASAPVTSPTFPLNSVIFCFNSALSSSGDFSGAVGPGSGLVDGVAPSGSGAGPGSGSVDCVAPSGSGAGPDSGVA